MNKEYTENLFFDKEIIEENELPQFNLEAMVRNAAQKMIQGVLDSEVDEFLQRLKYDKTEVDNFTGYRNGYHKKREVATAVGGLKVRVPRVSDNSEPFQSQVVKKYKRRSEGLDNLFPRLFVEGLATRDFEPALRFLVGENAPLSPSSMREIEQKIQRRV
jgi:transposase-like protein